MLPQNRRYFCDGGEIVCWYLQQKSLANRNRTSDRLIDVSSLQSTALPTELSREVLSGEMLCTYTQYTNNHQYLLESVSVLASLATSACVCSTSFTCYKLMNNVSAHIHFQLLSIKPQLECRPSVHPSRCLQT